MKSRWNSTYKYLFFLVFSLFVHAQEPIDSERSIEMNGEPGNWIIVDPFGAVKRNTRWPSPIIPVCWDEPPTSEREVYYRLVVKNSVNSSWPLYSKIQFTGWGECKTKKDSGVHIIVRDQFPRTNGVGRYLDQRPGGVILNFQLEKWKPSCTPDTNKDNCIRYIAIHEFGHVLGFVHEQVRDDAPVECTAEVDTSGAGGVRNLTEYDPQSIMNYCAAIWDGSASPPPSHNSKFDAMTKLDKKAVSIYYGSSASAPQ
jgi:hypothetical protein